MVAVSIFQAIHLRLKSSSIFNSPKMALKWCLIFLLGLLAIHKLYQLRILIFNSPISFEVDAPLLHPTPVLNLSKATEVDPADVASWSLFGKPVIRLDPKKTQQKKSKPEVIASTKLNLLLEGVVLAGRREESKALISYKGSYSHYREGDEIPGADGVYINRIERNGVLIETGRGYERIPLFNESLLFPAKKDSSNVIDNDEEVKKILGEGERKDRAGLPDGRLSDFFLFSLYRENGFLKGYKIKAIQNGYPLEYFSLLQSDVIVGVDDIKLNSAKKSVDFLRVVSEKSKVTFSVERKKSDTLLRILVDVNS